MSKLETWLKQQDPEKQKSMTIVKDVQFLHISSNPNLTKMSPWIGERQMSSEDRTIPRICGSETLLGCILGHSSVHSNFESFGRSSCIEVPTFTIYEIDVNEAIRPTVKLVEDRPRTGELWIVASEPKHFNIRPDKIGMFLPYQTFDIKTMGKKYISNHFYFRIENDLMLTDNKPLTKGCYEIAFDTDLTSSSGIPNITEIKDITLKQFKEHYDELKEVAAKRQEELKKKRK